MIGGLVLEMLLSILIPILVPFVIAGAFSLWRHAVALFRSKVNERDQRFIESVVGEAVKGVEQLWRNPAVQEIYTSKKDLAFSHINSRLKNAKLNITGEQVWLMIEAEVHKLNANEAPKTVNRVLPEISDDSVYTICAKCGDSVE